MAAATPFREPKTGNSLVDVAGWGFYQPPILSDIRIADLLVATLGHAHHLLQLGERLRPCDAAAEEGDVKS